MGEINIAGHTCVFPKISHAILNTYGVTPRTYELAYKTPPQPASLMIVTMLQSMYLIQALERQPYCVEDGERTIFLLEHPNMSALETVEKWLGWLVGTRFYCKCPYRLAKNIDNLQHTELWDSFAITKDGNGKRPFVGVHPPSRTLPQIPDAFPSDQGAQIHRLNEYIPPIIVIKPQLF